MVGDHRLELVSVIECLCDLGGQDDLLRARGGLDVAIPAPTCRRRVSPGARVGVQSCSRRALTPQDRAAQACGAEPRPCSASQSAADKVRLIGGLSVYSSARVLLGSAEARSRRESRSARATGSSSPAPPVLLVLGRVRLGGLLEHRLDLGADRPRAPRRARRGVPGDPGSRPTRPPRPRPSQPVRRARAPA